MPTNPKLYTPNPFRRLVSFQTLNPKFWRQGDTLPNDPQFGQNGGLPTIDVSVSNPPDIKNFRGVYNTRTIFTSNIVSSAPYAVSLALGLGLRA